MARLGRDRLRALLDDVAHLLRAQLEVSVHHDTLYAYEKLPFHDELAAAFGRTGAPGDVAGGLARSTRGRGWRTLSVPRRPAAGHAQAPVREIPCVDANAPAWYASPVSWDAATADTTGTASRARMVRLNLVGDGQRAGGRSYSSTAPACAPDAFGLVTTESRPPASAPQSALAGLSVCWRRC